MVLWIFNRFGILFNTHHHILEVFGDDECYAPVGEDADSAGNPPHFHWEDLWHDEPRDRTPAESKTWTGQQQLLKWHGLLGEYTHKFNKKKKSPSAALICLGVLEY